MSDEISNLSKYEKDLGKLIEQGEAFNSSFLKTYFPQKPDAKKLGYSEKTIKMVEDTCKTSHEFNKISYESWYSESIHIIKLLLPDRLSDFLFCYEKPRNRKNINYDNYTIFDALNGMTSQRYQITKATYLLQTQNAILASVQRRFKSSLFDIRQMVQADLLNSELDSSRELLKNKFLRAAGAVAGVVLEKHLIQICNNHSIKTTKKDPTISYLNDLLKNDGVLDIPTWRNIQYLGDIRNLCDHDKKTEPTQSQIEELITGTEKITKTIF